MALRTRFIAILIAMLVVPMLLSQSFLLQRIFDIQEQTYRKQLQTLADEVHEDLEAQKRQALFNIKVISFSNSLNRYINNERYRLPEETAYRTLLRSFATYLRSNPSYRSLYFLLPDGRVNVQFDLLGTLPQHDILPDESVFKRFREEAQSTFYWFSTQQEPGHLRLMIAHAVTDTTDSSITLRQQRKIIGYIVISVALDHLRYFGTPENAHANQAQDAMLLLRHDGRAWLKSSAFSEALFNATQAISSKHLPEIKINDAIYLIEYDDHVPEIVIEAWLPRARLYQQASAAMVQHIVISLLQILLIGILFYVVLNRWLITPLHNAQSLTSQLREGKWLTRQAEDLAKPQAQDEVKQLVDALYDMSETLERTSMALDQKRAQAEQAERLKTEFLANMSHEIRTPVNIIVGIMTRLEKSMVEPRQKEALGLAKSEALRLVKEIDELVMLADLETRKHQMVIRDFYLPDLLHSCLATATAPAQQKGLILELDATADTACLLRGDSDMLGKAIAILLENAVKFTEHGKVTLRVNCTPEGQHRRVSVSVDDTGPGISEDAIPLLGEAFRQLDGSRVRLHGGLGMGLAICKGLLALLGGQLNVTTQTGAGSSFYFSIVLPCALNPVPPDASPA